MTSEYRLFVGSVCCHSLGLLLLALLLVGCEMEERMLADERYNVRIANTEQIEDVVTIVHEFAQEFDAEVKGGTRARSGTSRHVLEVHLPTGMQVNISNFVREEQFIVAVYSGEDPDFSVKSSMLLDALKSSGLHVEERRIPE